MKLNFGPGKKWKKPDNSWRIIDIEPYADIQINFQKFEGLAFPAESCEAVYGSHVFEHISIFKTPLVFEEIHRVLKRERVFRLVIPDVMKSILHYIQHDDGFALFKRRKKRNPHYTLFECLREDFISPSKQEILGESLAHQNAWDFETIKKDLMKAGFKIILPLNYGFSVTDHFDFETTYKSEAQQEDRSLYIEAIK